MGKTLNTIIFVIILVLIDLYALNGLKSLNKWRWVKSKNFPAIYFIISALLVLDLLFVIYVRVGFMLRLVFIVLFFFDVLFKVGFISFLIADDIRRLFISMRQKLKKAQPQTTAELHPQAIPRSEFIVKAGLLAGALPIVGLAASMKSGLYDYQIKRQILYLPNLPKAFDGLTLGQISDIHSGSFHNHKAVLGGVEMLLKEKPDLIFFTGDIVNDLSSELKNYLDIFSKVKAPLGVFSSLGNHDYGDYHDWPTPAAKRQNHNNIINAHRNMGWDLLLNENRRLKIDGEEIGILGIENWGELSRFPKYGRMDLAVKNTDDLPVKLLLSHDPSHWRAQVLQQYPQIDVMFSGHTHGMQMGIRTESFQWSPIEYIYNEWAGLYQQGKQQLYVNVGYGFLGIHGRVGILPEITIFTLKAATAPLQSKA